MTGLPPLHRLKVHEDARGKLVSIDSEADLPFAIARVYYILQGDGSPRGFHAHKQLRQLMICLAGSCRVLLDDGTGRQDLRLDRPTDGLMIEPMVWHEMHDLSPDCILLVLASAPFDEGDYIRDYASFAAAAARPGAK